MPYTAPSVSWRRWVFDQLHSSFTQNHRSFVQTYNLLCRTAHWPQMARDAAEWVRTCTVCVQNKGATMRPPMRSIYAHESHAETLPFEDVIIDVQGPLTKSEDGMLYILSYHCSRIRVPLLEPFKSLQTGHFGRAFAALVFKARVMPRIVRSDQGQEKRDSVGQ